MDFIPPLEVEVFVPDDDDDPVETPFKVALVRNAADSIIIISITTNLAIKELARGDQAEAL